MEWAGILQQGFLVTTECLLNNTFIKIFKCQKLGLGLILIILLWSRSVKKYSVWSNVFCHRVKITGWTKFPNSLKSSLHSSHHHTNPKKWSPLRRLIAIFLNQGNLKQSRWWKRMLEWDHWRDRQPFKTIRKSPSQRRKQKPIHHMIIQSPQRAINVEWKRVIQSVSQSVI